jgi:protoporphyrin/coproporphyrin ferrochelatase
LKIKTGILMLNLGGPQNLAQVRPFLLNLFADREIIRLPLQSWLGPFIAHMRTRRVQANYRAIGGGSPILHWTNEQGAGMVKWLDHLSPQTGPHRFYVAFRYNIPQAEDALQAMQADGVERAIAFTQYPQFSCSTTGSSLNELWRVLRRAGLEDRFRWSVIDRWPTHPGFIKAMARKVQNGLEGFPAEDRARVILLFSAHSLPLDVIRRGDPYPQEVGASVQAVLEELRVSNPYLLAYQSAVGPVAWQGPSTESVIRQLGRQGHKYVLVIPIAFTSDHIETLSEIDLEYGELAHVCGITYFKRSPALNGDPEFQRTLADIVLEHLHSRQACSTQYRLHCPGCTNPACREIPNPIVG